MKKISIFLFGMFFTSAAFASAWTKCGEKLAANKEFTNAIKGYIGKETEKNAMTLNLNEKTADIKKLLADIMFNVNNGICKEEQIELSKMKEVLRLSFQIKDVKYKFVFDIYMYDILASAGNVDDSGKYDEDINKYAYAILVYNDVNKKIGDQIVSSSDTYWSEQCSNSTTFGIDDDNAINRAGQNVFSQDEEFFIGEQDSATAPFTGLIMQEHTAWTGANSYKLLVYDNLIDAINIAGIFAEKTGFYDYCSRQNLAVYVVSIAYKIEEYSFDKIKTVKIVDGPYIIK